MTAHELASTPTRSTVSRKSSRSRWNFLRRRHLKVAKSTEDATPYESESPPIATNCCLPRRKQTQRPTRKAVHFSRTVQCDTSGVTELTTRSGTPKLTRRLRSKSVKRSESKSSFHSVASTYSAVERLRAETNSEHGDITRASTEEDVVTLQAPPKVLCVCSFPAHRSFLAATPIVIPPDVIPGSYEELLIHGKSQVGNWTTILDRSDSLEPQMIHVGIGKMKRMVMNRLAIPFTAVLEDNDTRLHAWISTPAGAKHTTAGLKGQVTEDKDSDLGDWTAVTTMVDYSIRWFCNGTPVRAMQMKRENPRLGVAFETRVVLPDKAEGRILLYNITIEPGNNKETIRVDRIYKFASH